MNRPRCVHLLVVTDCSRWHIAASLTRCRCRSVCLSLAAAGPEMKATIQINGPIWYVSARDVLIPRKNWKDAGWDQSTRPLASWDRSARPLASATASAGPMTTVAASALLSGGCNYRIRSPGSQMLTSCAHIRTCDRDMAASMKRSNTGSRPRICEPLPEASDLGWALRRI